MASVWRVVCFRGWCLYCFAFAQICRRDHQRELVSLLPTATSSTLLAAQPPALICYFSAALPWLSKCLAPAATTRHCTCCHKTDTRSPHNTLHLHVLLCTALYCSVLLCIALYCFVLLCIALYCSVLPCIACITLYCSVLPCIALYCLYYLVLLCIALYHPVLPCITLHCAVGGVRTHPTQDVEFGLLTVDVVCGLLSVVFVCGILSVVCT